MSHINGGTFGTTDSLLLPDLALDAHGRLLDEVYCRVCGYNLRGADPKGVCSECGTAVGYSVVGDMLRYSAPTWIRTVARGATLVVAGIATLIITMLLVLVAGFVSPALVDIVAFLASLAAIGMLIAGIWYITVPEPAKQDQESGLNARKLTRYALIPGYLLNTVSQVTANNATTQAVALMAGGTQLIGTLLSIVGFFAYFVFLRQLALRVPDDKLASQTRIVMWGIVAGYVLIFVAAIMIVSVAAMTGTTGTSGGFGLWTAFMCFASLILIVFGIWSLLLIDRYRRVLNEAAAQAETTWAARG